MKRKRHRRKGRKGKEEGQWGMNNFSNKRI